MLELLAHTGARRVVVGHTPADDARVLCGGALVAADSALSRPFRAFGHRHTLPARRGMAVVSYEY